MHTPACFTSQLNPFQTTFYDEAGKLLYPETCADCHENLQQETARKIQEVVATPWFREAFGTKIFKSGETQVDVYVELERDRVTVTRGKDSYSAAAGPGNPDTDRAMYALLDKTIENVNQIYSNCLCNHRKPERGDSHVSYYNSCSRAASPMETPKKSTVNTSLSRTENVPASTANSDRRFRKQRAQRPGMPAVTKSSSDSESEREDRIGQSLTAKNRSRDPRGQDKNQQPIMQTSDESSNEEGLSDSSSCVTYSSARSSSSRSSRPSEHHNPLPLNSLFLRPSHAPAADTSDDETSNNNDHPILAQQEAPSAPHVTAVARSLHFSTSSSGSINKTRKFHNNFRIDPYIPPSFPFHLNNHSQSAARDGEPRTSPRENQENSPSCPTQVRFNHHQEHLSTHSPIRSNCFSAYDDLSTSTSSEQDPCDLHTPRESAVMQLMRPKEGEFIATEEQLARRTLENNELKEWVEQATEPSTTWLLMNYAQQENSRNEDETRTALIKQQMSAKLAQKEKEWRRDYLETVEHSHREVMETRLTMERQNIETQLLYTLSCINETQQYKDRIAELESVLDQTCFA